MVHFKAIADDLGIKVCKIRKDSPHLGDLDDDCVIIALSIMTGKLSEQTHIRTCTMLWKTLCTVTRTMWKSRQRKRLGGLTGTAVLPRNR